MTDSNKWKSKLLSSSVPMEYEVAKALVTLGFSVHADFSYSRQDAGIEKDFSVDLRATAYPPYDTEKIDAVVELLVECKHRHRGTSWLFFPDPNEPGMSPFTLGHTLRAFDSFSWQVLPSGCTVALDTDSVFCMKGVEVDASTGQVHDSEIKHGLMQLQYGLPRLLTERIRFTVHHPKNENVPFFVCPILLTTATILVANKDVTIKSVEDATDLDNISTPVPWVVVHSDLTPDFERHRQRGCAPLASLIDDPLVQQLDSVRLKGGAYDFQIPSRRCAALSGPVEVRLFEYFSQTVICSLQHFSTLLKQIKELTGTAAKAKHPTSQRKRRV